MHHLSLIDWLVLLCYALFIIFIGLWTGRKGKTGADYFLGNREMPWWAVMFSIYATALSALTFIGVPGAAFSGDFHYIQLGIGDFVGRVLIAVLLLTAYYKGNVTTVYELLGKRFGPRTRDGGTFFFLLTRLLASGVRLAGCAIALSVVFDIPLNTAIILITVTALFYTMSGGIRAVIWTDMAQFFLFVIAALIATGTIISALPDGFADFLTIGMEHGKFKVFHISMIPGEKDYWLDFSNPDSLIAGFLLGCFTTLAALGTDQDLVQRMLTCEKVRESQKALLLTALLNFPITLLFLSVGAALFVYYQVFPTPEVSEYIQNKRPDFIFPYFIKTVLAPGLKGLLIAGILAAAMSSIDSALNALASTFYIDVYRNYYRPLSGDDEAVKVSRYFVIAFAVILAGIAMYFCKTESILWLGFRIMGYTYGAMLGVFLLAVLTKERGGDYTNLFAMVSSVIVVIFLTAEKAGPFTEIRNILMTPLGSASHLAWPWAIVTGTIWTFAVGILFRTGKTRS